MKTLSEMIEVMQARKDGEDIQADCYDSAGWHDITHSVWNWDRCDYRIKLKPREIWVNLYRSGTYGSVYNTKNEAEFNSVVTSKVIKFREVMEGES